MLQDPKQSHLSQPGREPLENAPSSADWYLVAVLWCANVFAFVDRQSLPLLVGPIEQDLHISDTEMSLLIGFAFALVFTGLGVPAGVLLDRHKRKWIITCGVTVWSLATMGCGLAASYGQLFLGRMGVGVGESVFPPGAVAMMRDAFTSAWRSRAIGFWSSGATIGAGMALLGGGAILGLVSGDTAVELPLVGSVKPWQLVLIVSGALGLFVAVLMLTIREPKRTGLDNAAPITIALAWRYLRDRWRAFLPLACAAFSGSIVMFSFQVWTPTMLGRVWHLSRPEIGLMFGLMTIILAPAGQCLAGIAVDQLTKRRPRARPSYCSDSCDHQFNSGADDGKSCRFAFPFLQLDRLRPWGDACCLRLRSCVCGRDGYHLRDVERYRRFRCDRNRLIFRISSKYALWIMRYCGGIPLRAAQNP